MTDARPNDGRRKTLALSVITAALVASAAAVLLLERDPAPSPQIRPAEARAALAKGLPPARVVDLEEEAGGGLVLGGAVRIPYVPGWYLYSLALDRKSAFLTYVDESDYLYAEVGAASELGAERSVTEIAGDLLTDDLSYRDLAVEEEESLPLSGTLIDLRRARFTVRFESPDAQYDIAGAVWVARREDGAALLIDVEAIPPEVFERNNWEEIVTGTIASFAEGRTDLDPSATPSD